MPDTLSAIAAACRDHERLRFDYRESRRRGHRARPPSPTGWSTTAGRWYLVAWDIDRADWRTFRVDRIAPAPPAGPALRAPAAARRRPGRATSSRGVAAGDLAVPRPREGPRAGAELAKRLPAAVDVEPIDDDTCIASVGADSPAMLAPYLGMLGADFEVIDAPELRRHVRALR